MQTILVTGVGAPGTWGTIQSLKGFRIIGCDMNPNAACKGMVDEFYQVPAGDDNDYPMAIESLVRDAGVDVILPQCTNELEALSIFTTWADTDVEIVISSYNTIRTANDKYSLYEAVEDQIPVPLFLAANTDWFIKPRIGSGSRGAKRIPIPDKDMLLMEYLEGDEFTVDCFSDGSNSIAVPRKRTKIVNGISFEGEILVQRQPHDLASFLVTSSYTMMKMLDLTGCFGFQFKMDAEGSPKLLECNPRVQGGMYASTLAGRNVIRMAVLSALGREQEPLEELKPIKFSRYWGMNVT